MIHGTAAQIDEIFRNGGEFWILEVGQGQESRVWLRNTDRESFRIELEGERTRRPDLTWTPRRVRVESVIEEP